MSIYCLLLILRWEENLSTLLREIYKEELFKFLRSKGIHSWAKNIELYKNACMSFTKTTKPMLNRLWMKIYQLVCQRYHILSTPFKEQEELIANCPFESYHYKDKMVTFNRTRLNVFPSPILFMKNSAFGNFCLICAFTRKCRNKRQDCNRLWCNIPILTNS